MLARRLGLVSVLCVAIFLFSFTDSFASPFMQGPVITQTVTTPNAPAPSSPGAANSQCSPFFAKCPCNQVPDKKDPNKCIQGTEKNARGYSNTHDCPVGVCVDETIPGKKTLGVCPTQNKCEAKITDGQTPVTCKETGSCEGPNAKPEDQKGKEGGGQPPQMPQMPQGGGGDKGGQPPQTPQPNQDGLNGTSTVRGLDRQGTPVPDDVRSVWEQYTKKEDPFKTGIDTVVDRNNVEKAPEKQAEEEKSILTNFSDQKQLDAETAPLLKRNDRGQNNVSNGVVTEERYENPPRRDATGFAAPPQEDRKLAVNDARDPNKENPDSRFGTRTDGPVELKSIIPVLMERLRDLLQQLFIVLSKKKADEAKKPPAEPLPFGKLQMVPQNEIRRIENFPPSKVIPVLQAEAGPYGKPFETIVHILCDSKMEKCTSIFGNGQPFKIPEVLEKRMYEEGKKEIPNIKDLKYIFIVHDHPVTAAKPEFKRRFPDMDASVPYPEQLLTGPAGQHDVMIYLRQLDGLPFVQYDPKYVVTTMLVEPGGAWVSAFTMEDSRRNTQYDFDLARKDLFLASQSSDPATVQKGISDFIGKSKDLLGLRFQYLPPGANDADLMKAATESRKR